MWHSRLSFSLKKENPAICDNMDETRGHYAKCNKPGTERQMILYVDTKKKKSNLKKQNIIVV